MKKKLYLTLFVLILVCLVGYFGVKKLPIPLNEASSQSSNTGMGGAGASDVYSDYTYRYSILHGGMIKYAEKNYGEDVVDDYLKQFYVEGSAKRNIILTFANHFNIPKEIVLEAVGDPMLPTAEEYEVIYRNDPRELNKTFYNKDYAVFCEKDGQIYHAIKLVKMNISEIEELGLSKDEIIKVLENSKDGFFDYKNSTPDNYKYLATSEEVRTLYKELTGEELK